MKTAGRENPNHRATLPHNRAHGAVGQNRSRSIEWAVKQEKFRPLERCFFLTLPFIELIRTSGTEPSDTSGKGAATTGGRGIISAILGPNDSWATSFQEGKRASARTAV